MSIEFKLPELGDGIEQGEVVEILVAEGDIIAADQTIMEIETDKALVELPCPHAGTIAKIHVRKGDKVPVGGVLVSIANGAGAPARQAAGAGATAAAQPQDAYAGLEDAVEEPPKKIAKVQKFAAGNSMAEKTLSAEDQPAAAEAAKTVGRKAPIGKSPAGTSALEKPAAAAAGKTQTIEFELPDLGDGIEQGEIVEILVSAGDTIAADQTVMEIETDKALVELPCPHAGIIEQIKVEKGQKVPVGSILFTIKTQSAAPSQNIQTAAPIQPSIASIQSTSALNSGASAAGAASTTTESASQTKSGDGGNREFEKRVQDLRPGSLSSHQVISAADRAGVAPAPAGPVTRLMARELGVDLRQVEGTANEGRITKDDVKHFVRGMIAGAGRPRVIPQEVAPAVKLPDFSQWGPVERQPLSGIRKAISRNLSMAWNTCPHVTQFDEADITELEAARKKYSGGGTVRITITVLAIKAVVAALKAFPRFNSSLDPVNDELILKRYYHIGIAVDTEHGLLAPVIRDCDRKTVHQLARELHERAEAARNRKLAPDDMKGGTFTISNLGGIGGTAFTPIVNYPEVAILGIARGRREYRVIDGAPQVRLICPLCLSYDHRVIDGADGARFSAELARVLSDPYQLLLET